MTFDDRSRDLLVRTVLGEAAREADDGQQAVAAVIMNRLASGQWGDSIPKVVTAKSQFEPWGTQEGRSRMFGYGKDSEDYQRAARNVEAAMGGVDPTGGATHFFAPKAQALLGRQAPTWATGEPQVIGGHNFYAPEGKVMRSLPPGFEIEGATEVSAAKAQPNAAALPPGFEIEQPPAAPQPQPGDVARFADNGQPADIGRSNAFLRGAYQGVAANFGDEIAGAEAAGGGLPRFVGPIPVRALAGAGRMALGLGGEQEYQQARDAVRQDVRTAEAQYPGTTLAGNITGAVGLPVGPLMSGAGLGARTAGSLAVGAGYGGLAGAGEGVTVDDRLSRARDGAALGAVAGAVAPAALRGIEAAGGAVLGPVVSGVRGALNPEAEAGRRVVTGLARDLGTTPQGASQQATRALDAAERSGYPVALADVGGETTRGLARSAANTSPEGREALQRLTNERFEGQADRAVTFVNKLVGNTDTAATREAIDAAQIAANRPAYRFAESRPAAQNMWDEGLETLASAPIMQNAIRQANVTSRNTAAREGQAPGLANPFVFDRTTGAMTLRVGPNGETMTPNLAFWDAVKKNLDAMGAEGRQMSKVLRGHLDGIVPEYQAARQGAARFFGAEDALEAGEKFVRSPMTAAEGARAAAKMTAEERALFRQGFAARLIDDVNQTGDRRNVIGKIAQSPEARAKLNVALGPEGARRVQAHVEIESTIDRLRTAVQGNSTTARQLAELGLAGGATGIGGVGVYNQDAGQITAGVVATALVAGRRGVDQRVAQRVAEMLTSKDPSVLAKGVDMVSRSRALTQAFRALDSKLARSIEPLGQQK